MATPNQYEYLKSIDFNQGWQLIRDEIKSAIDVLLNTNAINALDMARMMGEMKSLHTIDKLPEMLYNKAKADNDRVQLALIKRQERQRLEEEP